MHKGQGWHALEEWRRRTEIDMSVAPLAPDLYDWGAVTYKGGWPDYVAPAVAAVWGDLPGNVRLVVSFTAEHARQEAEMRVAIIARSIRQTATAMALYANDMPQVYAIHHDLEQRAALRVDSSAALRPHRPALIEYDWEHTPRAEHLRWVIDAAESELLAWAASFAGEPPFESN